MSAPNETSNLLPDGRPADAATTLNLHHRAAARPKILDHDRAIVETIPRRTKVAIMGFSQSSMSLAPFEDETYEIWGINQLDRFIPRADRWFDMHDKWNENLVEGTDYLGFLQRFNGPIYMTQRVRNIPNSVCYPIEDAIAVTGLDYFQSTIGYMIALAIRDDFTTIALYGVDLVCGEEWDYQKPNAEFWLGYALGKGLNIILPEQSALLKQSYRYGYEEEPKSLIKITELAARQADLTSKRQQLIVTLAGLDGALQDVEMWRELAVLRHRHSSVKFDPK